MIGAFFSSLTNKLFSGALLLALVFAGVQSWRLSSVKSDYAEYRAKVAEAAHKAALKARKADAVARDTVEATKATVEGQNDAAREAAKGSDDPLRDAFKELRSQ